MASAGSLLITLKAETESLRNDLNKAMGRIKQFEAETKRSSASVSEAFGRIGGGGEVLKRSFGQVATGVLMMTGAFDNAGAAGKVLEQSLGAFMTGGPLAAGVALASGAFKLLAGSTDEAARAAEEARKTYAKMLDEIKKGTRDAADELQKQADRQRSLNLSALGVQVDPNDIGKERGLQAVSAEALRAMERADTLRREIEREKAAAARESLLGAQAGVWRGGTDAARAQYEAMRAELNLLRERKRVNLDTMQAEMEGERARSEALFEQADAIQRVIDLKEENDRHEREIKAVTQETTQEVVKQAEAVRGVSTAFDDAARAADETAASIRAWSEAAAAQDEASRRQVETAEDIVRKYEAQRDIADATTEVERDRLEVLTEIDRLLSAGSIGVDQADAVFDAMSGAKAAERSRKAREAMEREAEKVGTSSGKKAGEAFSESFGTTVEATIDPFFSGVFSTIENGLTSAIVDGITNGGRNGADIFRNIVNQLLQQTISSILQSGIQALFGGILGGGGGGGILSSVVGGLGGGGGGGGLGGVLSLPET